MQEDRETTCSHGTGVGPAKGRETKIPIVRVIFFLFPKTKAIILGAILKKWLRIDKIVFELTEVKSKTIKIQ